MVIVVQSTGTVVTGGIELLAMRATRSALVSNTAGDWPGRRHALHPRSGRDQRRVGGALGVVQRHRQRGRGGHARRGLVSDQPSQFEDRTGLHGGAKVGFVVQTLLVEGQDVGGDGERIEQGDGEIAGLARGQLCDCRIVRVGERGEQAGVETGVGADAAGDLRQAGTVEDRPPASPG